MDCSPSSFLLLPVLYTVNGFLLNAGEYLGKSSVFLSFHGGVGRDDPDILLEYDPEEGLPAGRVFSLELLWFVALLSVRISGMTRPFSLVIVLRLLCSIRFVIELFLDDDGSDPGTIIVVLRDFPWTPISLCCPVFCCLTLPISLRLCDLVEMVGTVFMALSLFPTDSSQMIWSFLWVRRRTSVDLVRSVRDNIFSSLGNVEEP